MDEGKRFAQHPVQGATENLFLEPIATGSIREIDDINLSLGEKPEGFLVEEENADILYHFQGGFGPSGSAWFPPPDALMMARRMIGNAERIRRSIASSSSTVGGGPSGAKEIETSIARRRDFIRKKDAYFVIMAFVAIIS